MAGILPTKQFPVPRLLGTNFQGSNVASLTLGHFTACSSLDSFCAESLVYQGFQKSIEVLARSLYRTLNLVAVDPNRLQIRLQRHSGTCTNELWYVQNVADRKCIFHRECIENEIDLTRLPKRAPMLNMFE
jgi:hypothetical protein